MFHTIFLFSRFATAKHFTLTRCFNNDSNQAAQLDDDSVPRFNCLAKSSSDANINTLRVRQRIQSHIRALLVFIFYPTLSQTWPKIYFRPPFAFETSVFMCPAVHTSARS